MRPRGLLNKNKSRGDTAVCHRRIHPCLHNHHAKGFRHPKRSWVRIEFFCRLELSSLQRYQVRVCDARHLVCIYYAQCMWCRYLPALLLFAFRTAVPVCAANHSQKLPRLVRPPTRGPTATSKRVALVTSPSALFILSSEASYSYVPSYLETRTSPQVPIDSTCLVHIVHTCHRSSSLICCI